MQSKWKMKDNFQYYLHTSLKFSHLYIAINQIQSIKSFLPVTFQGSMKLASSSGKHKHN